MADNEGARKSGKFIAVSLTPDVCKTPIGNAVVPVPYQISAELSSSIAVSADVSFGGDPAFVYDKSVVTHVTGNEAGTAGGLKSGTHKGIVEPIEGSATVYVNNKPVVRHGDLCKMNDGNTIGRIIYKGPGGAPIIRGPNPPVKPETPGEQEAAREKKGLWALHAEGVHTKLDAAGFISGPGTAADLANAGISAVVAVPGIGDSIKAGAMAAKAVAEKEFKEVAEEPAEGAAIKQGKDGVRISCPNRLNTYEDS